MWRAKMAMHYEAAGNWEHGARALRAAAEHAKARQAQGEAAELIERAVYLETNAQSSGAQLMKTPDASPPALDAAVLVPRLEQNTC